MTTIEEVRQALQKADKELDEAKAALKAFKEGESKGKLLTELRRRLLNKECEDEEEKKEGKEARDELAAKEKRLEQDVREYRKEMDAWGEKLHAFPTEPGKKTSIERLLITQFSQPLTNPPSENELEVYLKHPFLQKIPIRHKLYNDMATSPELALLNLGDYFIDEDVGQTGDTVSTLCEAAIMLPITGSENNLISEYDVLVKRIWQSLGRSPKFWLQVDRNVVDTSGATLKMFRSDLIALLHDVLIFKAEEKKDSDEFDNAVKELESKMEIWDPSLFGDLPYLPSYAAAKEQFQWCIIKRI